MEHLKNQIARRLSLLTAALAFLGLSACAVVHRDHGYVPSEQELQEIVVGVDSRDTVAETIGVPSTSGILDSSGYYYVQSRVRHLGALRPKEIEREVVAISFSDSGTVQNIERFSLQDGKAVQLSRRVTESSVRDNTFMRQLLGSLGRISSGTFE